MVLGFGGGGVHGTSAHGTAHFLLIYLCLALYASSSDSLPKKQEIRIRGECPRMIRPELDSRPDLEIFPESVTV